MDALSKNQMFIKRAEENIGALSTTTSGLIRTRLYDKAGIARTVMQASPITFSELERDVDNTAWLLVDVEGERRTAMTVPFTAKEIQTYVNLAQVKFGIQEIDTKEYIKNISEIRHMNTPYADEIERHARQGIQYEEDRGFLAAVRQAAIAAGQSLTITAKPGQEYLFKEDFVRLQRMFVSAADPLRCETFLMNESTWLTIQNWNTNEFESQIAYDAAQNGVTLQKLLGMNVIVTLKSDLVYDNEVFGFVPIEALGVMRILEDVTLFLEKDKKNLKHWLTEQLICGIANIHGCGRIVLG